MPILTGDILEYLSTLTGSTGGDISGSSVASGIMNNVWPDISDGDRIAGGEAYRKTFWKNNSGTDPMLGPVMYTPVLPSAMALSIGLGFNDVDDDDSDQGNMLPFLTPALVAMVSDNIADVRTVTIWGVDDSDVPISESVDLVGATEVLSVATFSKVWGLHVDADPTSAIEIREGPSGDVRGLIGPQKVCCFLWVVEPDVKASGIAMPDLGPGDNYGMWRRLTWMPEASPARPNNLTVSIEEA